MLAEELGQTLTRETFVSTFGQRNESILPFLGWAEEGDRERIQQLDGEAPSHVVVPAVGGPVKYNGKDMHDAHRNMQITAAEFDAAMTDLKQVLDQNRIPAAAQRELLEIVERAQGDIVTKK